MILLEALVALVILGASAAGFLGVFQNGARSVQSAAMWNQASATASAALEEVVRASKEGTSPVLPETAAGWQARVETRPWSTTVDNVTVRVQLPDGRELTVQRLVRRQ